MDQYMLVWTELKKKETCVSFCTGTGVSKRKQYFLQGDALEWNTIFPSVVVVVF